MSVLGKGEVPARMELTAFQKVKGGEEDSSRGCRGVRAIHWQGSF